MSHTYSLNCRVWINNLVNSTTLGRVCWGFFVRDLGGSFLLLEKQVRGQGRNCQNTHNVA